MSRTYRRTTKGRKATWLPDIYDFDISRWGRFGFSVSDPNKTEFLEKHPKYIRDVGNFFHHYTTPSHWNHDFHTIPRRAKDRELLQRIKKEEIDPDDLVWLDGKKPHIYYW